MKILAAREYAGDVVKWIWGAKYKGTPRNGIADAMEAVEGFADYPTPADLMSRDVVVDVPGRIGGKTHELAPLLASAVASRLGIPHWVDLIERTREAPPMRRMGRAERKEHVKGLYRVQKVPGFRKALKGKRVLVVDDVSTTGATLGEIERVLLKAGAADVVGLVLAKVKKKAKGAPVAKKKKAKKKARKKAKRKARKTRPAPPAPPAPRRAPIGALSLFRVDLVVKDERGGARLARHLAKAPWIESATGYVAEEGPRVMAHLQARDAADALELVVAARKATFRKRKSRRW